MVLTFLRDLTVMLTVASGTKSDLNFLKFPEFSCEFYDFFKIPGKFYCSLKTGSSGSCEKKKRLRRDFKVYGYSLCHSCVDFRFFRLLKNFFKNYLIIWQYHLKSATENVVKSLRLCQKNALRCRRGSRLKFKTLTNQKKVFHRKIF